MKHQIKDYMKHIERDGNVELSKILHTSYVKLN